MIILITIVHIIVCFFLIIVVLLQSGKSGDIAAAFGGMGSQTAFGPRGAATVLSKATTWSAVIFMLTSITLSHHGLAQRSAQSVLQGITPSQTPKNSAGNARTTVNKPSDSGLSVVGFRFSFNDPLEDCNQTDRLYACLP